MSNMQAIELDINEAKRKIELGNALNRLKGNSDFNMLIGHHYFIEHAARTTSLLASPSMQSPQNQANGSDVCSRWNSLCLFMLWYSSLVQCGDQPKRYSTCHTHQSHGAGRRS